MYLELKKFSGFCETIIGIRRSKEIRMLQGIPAFVFNFFPYFRDYGNSCRLPYSMVYA
jgi:hypothetical protein